jgi:hypothetical protein
VTVEIRVTCTCVKSEGEVVLIDPFEQALARPPWSGAA